MKVLIVEDETIAYNNLIAILKSIDPSIEVAGITESVAQTVRWILNNPQPDLIFMDIHLSDGSSFNIFSAVTVEAPIIFTTAYDEYAIDAFKVNSIDYLLKPIEEKDIRRALEKFRRFTHNDIDEYMSHVSRLISSGGYPTKILLPVNDRLLPLNVNDISCFYTTENNTQIFLKDGKNYTFPKTLDTIYQTLNPALFFRANRQYIISKNAVTNITIWFDNRLLVKLDVEVPERIYISKNKASEFKQWMVM